MVSLTVLIGLALAGLVIAGFAATGTKILCDFSRHELEEFCKRRRRPGRFDAILDGYEQVALGAENLRALGIALLGSSGGLWLLARTGDGMQVTGRSLIATVAIGTLLLLLATAWIPWTIAHLWSIPLLFHTWPAWSLVSRLLFPLSIGVNLVDALMRRLAERPRERLDEEEAFEHEIRTMVTAGHREGLLEADAREMIEGVIELGDTDVSDIMTPRSKVDALEIGLGWQQVLDFVVRVGRTRIPVYENDLDNIVGVLFVKDLLTEFSGPEAVPHRPLRDFLRKPWFVHTTKPVDEMLKDFLNTRSHLAIVKDEYQRVAGVVTIEDVLEEIVGEIVDESDKDVEDEIIRVNGTTVDVLGRTRLDVLNERLGLDLPESDEYDTVAGLVLDRLAKIPKAGESLVQGNVRIGVLEASKRGIDRVRIEMVCEPTAPR